MTVACESVARTQITLELAFALSVWRPSKSARPPELKSACCMMRIDSVPLTRRFTIQKFSSLSAVASTQSFLAGV
jgi:hypothetical protein